MTGKRFTLTNDYFWENQKPISSEDVCELLNKLHDENERLKQENSVFEGKDAKHYQRWVNQIKKYVEELSKENEKLKFKNRGLQSELQIFKEDATYSNLQINKLIGENDQLKISSTMYHNLFKELQRQMQGVKSIYDLDSKDFEDLIKLSKGNVFDDKIGWVHLPIEEL